MDNIKGSDKISIKFGMIRVVGLILLLIMAIMAGGFLFGGSLTNLGILTSGYNGYQAVFLTNGQVYFGNIVSESSTELVLEDIYYLKIDSALQLSESNDESNLTLVKLGNELHGPEDQMRINRDHMLFIENLKGDSKVVEAIQEAKGAAE